LPVFFQGPENITAGWDPADALMSSGIGLLQKIRLLGFDSSDPPNRLIRQSSPKRFKIICETLGHQSTNQLEE